MEWYEINEELEKRNSVFRLERKQIDKPNESYDGIIVSLDKPNYDGILVSPSLVFRAEDFADLDMEACIEAINAQVVRLGKVRPSIFPVEKIPEYTEKGIYAEEYNGFGLSFFFDMGSGIAPVPKEIVQDKDEVRRIAFSNLADEFVVMSMGEMITGVETQSEILYVLTTKDQYEGAAAIFCPEAMKAVERVLGPKFLILPNNRHAVLCTNNAPFDVQTLNGMIREANEAQMADILGWNVLVYDNGIVKTA